MADDKVHPGHAAHAAAKAGVAGATGTTRSGTTHAPAIHPGHAQHGAARTGAAQATGTTPADGSVMPPWSESVTAGYPAPSSDRDISTIEAGLYPKPDSGDGR
jgi:hypothetical protein